MYVASGYPEELADFSGFDDWYDMLRDDIVSGSVAAVDEAVMQSARSLALECPVISSDHRGMDDRTRTYRFTLTVNVEAGHRAYGDPEWIADAAWRALSNEYDVAPPIRTSSRSPTLEL
jgi:hypothetical protein